MPRTFENVKMDEHGFREWAASTEGNVYSIFEVWMRYHTGVVHLSVSFDWMACKDIHKWNERGFWETVEKLPAWFKRWVQEVGTGPYKTWKKGSVAELADASGLGPDAGNSVRVQVSPESLGVRDGGPEGWAKV